MSSIMRARNGLTGRWEGPEVIGGSFLELKVAEPSMLGIGCPDRHALPRITPKKCTDRKQRSPPARAGSFIGAFPPSIRRSANEQDCPISEITQLGHCGAHSSY